MPATLDVTPTHHAWTLVSHKVTQLSIDMTSFRLLTWSLLDALELRLSTSFVFHDSGGEEWEISVDAPEEAAPLLSLLGREMRSLTVTHEGELFVEFSDASSLHAMSHPLHEAFAVAGSGALEGLTYVAHPGGGAPWPTA